MMCTLQLSRWCRTLRQEALEMPCRKSRATWNNAGGVIKTRDFTRKSHGKTTLFLTNHSWEKRKTHIYHVFLIITVYFVRLELFTHKHIYIYYYILIYIYISFDWQKGEIWLEHIGDLSYANHSNGDFNSGCLGTIHYRYNKTTIMSISANRSIGTNIDIKWHKQS